MGGDTVEGLTDVASWLVWAPFAGLALFLAFESWAPLRAPRQARLLHISTNLTISGGNAVVVNLVFSGVSLAWAQRTANEGWGLFHQLGFGPIGNALISVVLLDLLAYWVHRAYHRIPLLWRFHRAHHSDLELDASTALRFHVGEALITAGVRVLSIPAIGVSSAGLILYELVTQALGLLSHSSIRLSDSIETRIRRVIVSPQMHWTHHSRDPADYNKNLGNVFSTWDRLMGTFFIRARREEIQVGLDSYPTLEFASLLPFLTMPLGRACREEALR